MRGERSSRILLFGSTLNVEVSFGVAETFFLLAKGK